MGRRVTLTDSKLSELFANGELARLFPDLLEAVRHKVTGGCSSCGNNSRQVIDYGEVKARLAQLPSPGQQKLRRLLDAETVRVIWRDPQSNHIVKTVFRD